MKILTSTNENVFQNDSLLTGPPAEEAFPQKKQTNVIDFTSVSSQQSSNQILQPNVQNFIAANDVGSTLTDSSSESGMSFADVVTTLGRHDGLLKKAMTKEDLQKLESDPDTPSDMKGALQTLLNNPTMFQAIDDATPDKVDGKIAAGDIDALRKTPAFMQYASQLSESYTHDYIPSDAPTGSPPQEMTANDASRELYLYSQSLPKQLSLQTLNEIANGSQPLDKCPPQVASAAKYFTDHPNQWANLTGMSDPTKTESREALCDQVSYSVKLTKPESDALQTVKDNEDIFFKNGNLTPKKLKDIAKDPNNSQSVRDAATLLSKPNSMLFSMLDNGKHHAGGNFFNKSNDEKISKGDLDAFIAHGSNQVAAAPTQAKTDTPTQQKAKADMDAGQETQPDKKKEMGGGFFKMFDILGWIGTGLSILIPGLGEAALGAGVGKAAVQAGVEAGMKAGMEGGVKAGFSAAKEAGIAAGKEASQAAEQAGTKGIGYAAGTTAERGGKTGAEVTVEHESQRS